MNSVFGSLHHLRMRLQPDKNQNSVFGSLHHFWMRLQPDKKQKIGEKKFSVFTAGSIFRSISRVMGVINEFVLR